MPDYYEINKLERMENADELNALRVKFAEERDKYREPEPIEQITYVLRDMHNVCPNCKAWKCEQTRAAIGNDRWGKTAVRAGDDCGDHDWERDGWPDDDAPKAAEGADGSEPEENEDASDEGDEDASEEGDDEGDAGDDGGSDGKGDESADEPEPNRYGPEGQESKPGRRTNTDS